MDASAEKIVEQNVAIAIIGVPLRGTIRERTSSHAKPNLAAAAAVRRAKFDCRPPVAMIVSAPAAAASPSRNSSLRSLLPPPPSAMRSSRLA